MATAVTSDTYQFFENGSEVTHIFALAIGETVEFSGLNFAEEATPANLASTISGTGLTIDKSVLFMEPEAAEFQQVLQAIGLPLIDITFDTASIGDVRGDQFAGYSMSGTGPNEVNGVRAALQSGTPPGGWTNMFILRPDTAIQASTSLHTAEINIQGVSSIDIDIELMSAGSLEDDDTLEITLSVDGNAESLVIYNGDISPHTANFTRSVAGQRMSLIFESWLGDGNVEGHVINSIKVS